MIGQDLGQGQGHLHLHLPFEGLIIEPHSLTRVRVLFVEIKIILPDFVLIGLKVLI